MGDQSQPRRKPSSAATAEERRVGGRGRLERGATGNWSGGGVEDRRVAVVARAGASTGQHRRSGRRQRPTGAAGGGGSPGWRIRWAAQKERGSGRRTVHRRRGQRLHRRSGAEIVVRSCGVVFFNEERHLLSVDGLVAC